MISVWPWYEQFYAPPRRNGAKLLKYVGNPVSRKLVGFDGVVDSLWLVEKVGCFWHGLVYRWWEYTAVWLFEIGLVISSDGQPDHGWDYEKCISMGYIVSSWL